MMTQAELTQYVDDMPMLQAQEIIRRARAAGLPWADASAWDRIFDQAQPQPKAEETFWRYEGRPVRTVELMAALNERWGRGFVVSEEVGYGPVD